VRAGVDLFWAMLFARTNLHAAWRRESVCIE
jgi:hypothetical protein